MAVAIDSRWFLDEEDPHEAVCAIVTSLADRMTFANSMDLRHARLYGNLPIAGLTAHSFSRVTVPGQQTSKVGQAANVPRLSLNVVKNMSNAVTAKVTKTKPRPMFLTSDGNWSQKRRAKFLTQFIEGQFYETGMYALGPRIFLDAVVFGTGGVRIYDDGEKPCIERVLPGEVRVDQTETLYGKPRSLFHVRAIDRGVLLEEYPDHREAILDAPTVDELTGVAYRYTSDSSYADLVEVTEAWHLRSGRKATDGKHAICIKNATLHQEQYDADDFPFAFIKWNERLFGEFFGCGLAEELAGLQLEINKTLQKIAKCLDLMAVPRMLVENGSKITKLTFTNDIGALINYSGTKPEMLFGAAVPPELLAHLDRLYTRAYEITGISQLSAQSQKPAGLDSGVALQTYDDIETERFLVIARQYEELFLDVARKMIRCNRDIAKRTRNFSVKSPGARWLRTLKWVDVDLDDDVYVLKCFPTSAFASTPAGKMAQIQAMLKAGLITQPEARRELDFPDMERLTSYETAAYDDIERTIELMLDDGKYFPPEPFQDLQLALKMVQGAYLRARMDGAPLDRLELLIDFMTDTKAEIDKQTAASAPPAGAPMGAPPGAPAPIAPPMAEPMPLAA